MLRSILVALDDMPGATAARDAGIALARRTGAALSLATVLDRPHSRDAEEAVPLGAGAFAERRNAALTARLEAEAAAALAAATAACGDLPHSVLTLEDAPESALLQAGARHDLIILGRDSTLGREEAEDGLAPVIEALLKDGPRPLLVVPPGAAEHGQILVGYDGSLPAQRALLSFALMGLAEGDTVKLLAANPDRAEAGRLAAEGAAYLRPHGLTVTEWPVTSGPPAELLLAEAATLPARLLVMGGFGKTGLRALLLGTATRRLLREAPCAILVQH
jgi:nucleotide-binding universal stress UspA family protein